MEVNKQITIGLGWLLVLAGVLIIGSVLLSTTQIFTAKVEPPSIFKLKQEDLEKEISLEIKEDILEENSDLEDMENMQETLAEIFKEQLVQMLPIAAIEKVFNLISWSVFASLLIFGAMQISKIGIMILK